VIFQVKPCLRSQILNDESSLKRRFFRITFPNLANSTNSLLQTTFRSTLNEERTLKSDFRQKGR